MLEGLRSPVTVVMVPNTSNTLSPHLKGLKSGLSMLLEEEANPNTLNTPTTSNNLYKKSLLASQSDDFAASYGSVASFSESFFEYSKKPVHLGASQNTLSDSSLINSFDAVSLKEEKNEPVTPANQSKPKFGVTDLLTLLLDEIRVLERQPDQNACSDEFDKIHGLAQISSDIMLLTLLILPAEEDGTPMDDLPSFSTKTELLSLGVHDFAIVDKASMEPLIHVKIEGTLSATETVHSRAQRAASQDRISTQDSNESSHFIERPSSVTNADTIQVFRMDTDESQLRKGVDTAAKLVKSDSNNEFLAPISRPNEENSSYQNSVSTTPVRGGIRGSGSGLTISYRFHGSDRWRFAKKAITNPLSPVSPKLKITKSDFIPIKQSSNDATITASNALNANSSTDGIDIRRERTNKVNTINSINTINVERRKEHKLSIFNQTQSAKIPTVQTLTDAGLFRRHSEKSYQDEVIRRNRKEEAYSRNFSFSGEGMLSLNPHTSNRMMAQFSPSTHSSNPSRDGSPVEFEAFQSIKIGSPARQSQLQSATTITPFSSPSVSLKSRKELTPPQVAGPSPSTTTSSKTTGSGTGSGRSSFTGNTSSSILNLFKLF